MYLIYTDEQDAWGRSEQEGAARGLSFHRTGKGTRYVTGPAKTDTDEWALPVDGYNLTDAEAALTVDSYVPKPIPEGE